MSDTKFEQKTWAIRYALICKVPCYDVLVSKTVHYFAIRYHPQGVMMALADPQGCKIAEWAPTRMDFVLSGTILPPGRAMLSMSDCPIPEKGTIDGFLDSRGPPRYGDQKRFVAEYTDAYLRDASYGSQVTFTCDCGLIKVTEGNDTPSRVEMRTDGHGPRLPFDHAGYPYAGGVPFEFLQSREPPAATSLDRLPERRTRSTIVTSEETPSPRNRRK